MASIRRTDIMHNKVFSKGRPPKSERERNRKRQEAYRWRDARRIYLANSFDRWRKLRCTLGMKDSVLAWHLMEAHEKGHCEVCRRDMDQEETETSQEPQAFLSLLVKAVRKLCYSQFQFEECIKIVGLLCLEFDNSRKENFSVNETVLAKFRTHATDLGVSSSESKIDKTPDSYTLDIDAIQSNSKSSYQSIDSSGAIETKTPTIALQENDLPKPFPDAEENTNKTKIAEGQELLSHRNFDHGIVTGDLTLPTASTSHLQSTTFDPGTETQIEDEIKTPGSVQESNSFVESEAEVSLEIDVEKIDTSQEMEESFRNVKSSESEISSEGLEYVQKVTYSSSATNFSTEVTAVQESHTSLSSNIDGVVTQLPVPNHQPTGLPNPLSTELPLDMSVEKTHIESQRGNEQVNMMESTHVAELHNELSVDTSYHEQIQNVDDVSLTVQPPSIQAKRVSATPPKSTSRAKDEMHPSIPWQRRDMSRKEEYEFLEMNPFSDLSEFSQRFPHVHQRTYYRWKRRIKEEYVILEQCPDMSFEQFNSVVLQAKESVFNLWKSFIAQGKGFFAPSDVSKRLEAKCPASKAVNTLSEQYTFLQKNLSCTQEQFCQRFANTSAEVFVALKRKVLQEFWVFYHNQHLDWKEFSKLVDITEDVHHAWRDHVARDMKSTVSSFSPNSQTAPPQYPAFPNPSDPQAHLKANPSTFDPTLEDSLSRSLSASYLNSVQNMMFPWASYYGMHGSLNQQMLPMMLWPRMMGMNGNVPIPMPLPGMMASSPSSCGSKAESPQGGNTATIESNCGTSDLNVIDVKLENAKVHSKEMDVEILQRGKRASSVVVNENDNSNESDISKKQKFRDDTENANTQSPMSKSRKQNKQEYIYYLKNPSLSFKDLETLFPTISLRTFYRWRKEMNAALLFIQEKKNPDYQQFKPVFPDIPEEVFEVWKAKSEKEHFAENVPLMENEFKHKETLKHPLKDEAMENDFKHKETLKHPLKNEAMNVTFREETYDDVNMEDYIMFPDEHLAAANLFVHKNPDLTYESFRGCFPSVLARRFYQWKKEWKAGVEFLRGNPGMDYDSYSDIDPSVSEEIFAFWKQYLYDTSPPTKQEDYGPSPEYKTNKDVGEYSVKKHSNAEFSFLQLHPYVEFHNFNEMYPHIPREMFYEWKKEVQKIINYIRSQPSVSFEEISAVLPDVTEEGFLKWKELIAEEKATMPVLDEANDAQTDDPESNVEKTDVHQDNSTMNNINEETKRKMTNALLHLMHNPNIEFQIFSEIYPFVSIETFELWLNRIKAVILHISSNPNLKFEEFRSAITDIGEEIFQKWKNLTPDEISSIGKQAFHSPIPVVSENSPNESVTTAYKSRALQFCQENPNVTYETFSSQYFSISETDFKCWMLKISNQISCIREEKNLTYEAFKGIYPDVERAIFDLWKKSSLSLKAEVLPNFLEPLCEDIRATNEMSVGSSQCATIGETNFSGVESGNFEKSSFEPAHVATSQMHLDDSLCDQDQESSLKKLTKLAESDPSNLGWNSRSGAADSAIHESDKFNNVLPTPAKYGYEYQQNNNCCDSDYYNHYMPKDSTPNAAQRPDVSSPKCDPPMTHQEENQSLSALMVMSAGYHKLPSVASTPKAEKGQGSQLQSYPNPGKWKYTPVASAKDEEEMFSSQRQKKMSRAEYLFVKDNPDVDSQEFARIFPGVSARTFYRWKKEIKAQMHIP